jgi:hypothetical protein
MLKYKKFVIKYVKALLVVYTTPEKLVDHYYKTRRCPSAHANRDTLNVNEDLSLETLYSDSLFIKYLARCAIERFWEKI